MVALHRAVWYGGRWKWIRGRIPPTRHNSTPSSWDLEGHDHHANRVAWYGMHWEILSQPAIIFSPNQTSEQKKWQCLKAFTTNIYMSLGPKDRGWLWFGFLTGLGLWWEIRCRFLQGPFSAHGRAQLGWRGHRDKVQQSGKYISRWIPRLWYKPNISGYVRINHLSRN